MKLRFRSDWRTLVWAFAILPLAGLAPLLDARLVPWCLPLSLYAGFCAGILAHNQNHCPTFVGRRANAAYAAWLSIFYGYPIFAWIPTHNENHHRQPNRPGDASITWRASNENRWLVAASYPFIAAYHQGPLTAAFLRRLRARNPRRHRRVLVQAAVVPVAHVVALAGAIAAHGPALGALAYLSGFGAAAVMGLWGMMFINYVQHVHCDAWSALDHSRNFTGKLGNWLVFNAGLHTAHHEHPGAHWSELPALDAALAPRVHPELRERSLVLFCLRSYLLGWMLPRFRTRQLGRAPYDGMVATTVGAPR